MLNGVQVAHAPVFARKCATGAMLTFAAQNIYFTLLILHDGVKLKFKCSFSAAVFCATAS
jgi:hypothetical protein